MKSFFLTALIALLFVFCAACSSEEEKKDSEFKERNKDASQNDDDNEGGGDEVNDDDDNDILTDDDDSSDDDDVNSGECKADSDCLIYPQRPKCETVSGLCVECLTNEDCGAAMKCEARKCKPETPPQNDDDNDTAGDDDDADDDDNGSHDVPGYGKCDSDGDCEVGFFCFKIRANPEYGQCSKNCANDDDCPSSPAQNPVACWNNVCVGLCGAHGGQCPDWLQCIGQEFCLEPVTTVPTKGPGESCKDASECKDGAECVEGENTRPYCAPLCNSDADCQKAAPDAYGQCASGGSLNFCMFYCGMMGQNKPCPGDMTCEMVVCR